MKPESPDAGSASLRALRDDAVAALARAGVPDPEIDAELLIGHVLGESRGRIQALMIMAAEIAAEDGDRVRALVERRAARQPLQHITGRGPGAGVGALVGGRPAREPLQHITGRAPFRSLEMNVGPGVFVPRPETEQ